MNLILTVSLLLCCFIISETWAEEEYAPTVHLRNGKIRGLVRELSGLTKNDLNRTVYEYRGFRFARAERFGKPEMVTSWPEEVYDATKDGNTCPQFAKLWDMDQIGQLNRSEDCLFLSVYRPAIEQKWFPVMVYIYGGGFQVGSIFMPIYDPSYIAAIGEVIVVTINYRLGPIGFLYGGFLEAPGNQGLYDQLMGLKWVKENIESFHGDPNRVTIFGESAGSMSVSGLIMSPQAKGMFNRAIMQSGALGSKVWTKDASTALEQTKKFSQKMGCKDTDMKKMVECLKNKPLEEIEEAADVNGLDLVLNNMFEPIIDGDFLTGNPDDFNKVDLLFGVTHDEGSSFAPYLVPELADDNAEFTMEKVTKIINEFLDNFNITQKQEVLDYYTKNMNVSDLNQVRKTISNIMGESLLVCPTYLFGEEIFQLSKGKMNDFFAYRFDRRNDAIAKVQNCTEWMGVCHGLDIMFEFVSPSMTKSFFSFEDYEFAYMLIKSWTQFAEDGQPGSFAGAAWEEAFDRDQSRNEQSAQVMSLNMPAKMVGEPFKETCDQLWKKLIWN